MPSDYLPAPDDQFHDFQRDFITYVAANNDDLGVTDDEVTALTAKQTAWAGAYAAHTAAQDHCRRRHAQQG